MKAFRTSVRSLPQSTAYNYTPRRTFIPPPFTAPTQNLTASRTLPYPSSAIYAIIADVNSYSTFLPYCTNSKVTQWSSPDANGHKWPSEAEMVIGWKGISETFKSRIYCVPGSVVEAVGGATKTTLAESEIAHHDTELTSTGEGNGILTHLLTRWTVRPFPFKPENGGEAQDRTDVGLAIEYQFANPLYSAMSGAVADKVAGVMMEAFEERARSLLEGNARRKDSGRVGRAMSSSVDLR